MTRTPPSESTSVRSARDRANDRPVDAPADRRRLAGGTIALGAAAFFAGSALLTQSGQPGASTPVPWVGSHAIWAVATALVAAGTVRAIRSLPGPRRLADDLAAGALGLATLHALQWLAWTYVDVLARRSGEHELLHPSILHPFGTAHALLYAALLGSGVALLARRLARTETTATHRVLNWAGVALGATAVAASLASLAAVLDVPHPVVLAVVLLTGALHAWLLAAGASLARAG